MNSLEDKELLFVLANGEILQDTMSEWLRSRPAKAVGLPARVRISLVSIFSPMAPRPACHMVNWFSVAPLWTVVTRDQTLCHRPVLPSFLLVLNLFLSGCGRGQIVLAPASSMRFGRHDAIKDVPLPGPSCPGFWQHAHGSSLCLGNGLNDDRLW